ncbi:MAG: hypothetical protein ACOVP1_03410 [Bacteroidia bacterium]
MKKLIKKLGLVLLVVFSIQVNAQNKNGELSINLNESGSHYFKFNLTSQVWLRYLNSNPGSTLFGYEKSNLFDVGIRRSRIQAFGQVQDRTFIYTQFGINNFSFNSSRKMPIFFHDIAMEYHIDNRKLHLGAGLSGWGGFARFSSPAVVSIMGYDAPLFEQNTNDVSDQFLRKLGIYAKGKLGKLDYRVMLSSPMSVQNSSNVKAINYRSDFSMKVPHLQQSAYLMYQFLDEESNLTPYTTGTYLGKKKVLNIGLGAQYQKNAMWHQSDSIKKDTVEEDLRCFALDLFYDAPIGNKNAALSLYAALVHTGFGKNYIRNLGPMNPFDGVTSSSSNASGPGSAFTMYGTGNILYFQGGYLLPQTDPKKETRYMPYIMWMHANYEQLKQSMNVFDMGLNIYLHQHKTKLSINYQNRPVFNKNTWKVDDRKGMVVVQWQVAI